jgi:hypothetical protein
MSRYLPSRCCRGVHARLRSAVCAIVVLAACALSAAPASATVTHKFLKQLTGFSRVVEIAVGPVGPLGSASEKGALFVADHNAGVAVRLSSAGVGLPFECKTAECGKYIEGDELKGTPSGQFQGVDGIAVNDETGEIYVSASNAVDIYASSGEFLGAITEVPASAPVVVKGSFVEIAGLAFDQKSGELYVADERTASDTVEVFKTKAGGGGEFTAQLGSGVLSDHGGLYQSVAVSETGLLAGTVYVSERLGNAEGEGVAVFNSLGVHEATWTGALTAAGSFGIQPVHVGVDPVSGHVYVTNGQRQAVNELPQSGLVEEKALGQLTGTPSGPFNGLRTVAVDGVAGGSSLGDLYVGDESVIDVFGPDATLPNVESKAVSKVTPTSATFNGEVTTKGETLAATCAFAWGTTTALEQAAGCEPPGVPGESELAEHRTVTGLLPDTTYFYRLQASNENGTDTGEESPPVSFTTPGPTVENSASDVASTSATLDASIEPNNSPTSYYFEYGPTAAYGSDVPLAPGVTIGAGKGAVEVDQHVQGLTASATYHYRVVAVSELSLEVSPGKFEAKVEAFAGADQTFTTQAAGSELVLPDNRAWEMVSPAAKEGALIEGFVFQGGTVQASADGSAFSYLTAPPTEAEPQGNTNSAQDLSWRAPGGGWSTRDIAPPNEQSTGVAEGRGNNYRLFSSDLSLAVVDSFGKFTPLSPEASEQTPYLHTDFSGVGDPCVSECYRPLVTGKPGYADVPPGTQFACGTNFSLICSPGFVDASPDLSHIALLSNGSAAELTEIHVEKGVERGETGGMYEWSAGEPPSERLQPLYLLPKSEGGFGVYAGFPSVVGHQLADDGSVFFDHGGHLYLNDVAKGESVRLDVAQGVTEPGEGGAKFLYASTDGSTVLFSDSEQLTKTPGGGVYECRIAEVAGVPTCGRLQLTGLTGLFELLSEGGLNVGALVGGSEDASYLYFVSRARSSEPKLYVYHYTGSGWTQTLIAAFDRGLSVMRVSPNGRWLAFMSSQELTGYNTHNALSGLPGEEVGQQDQEVYLYDAAADRLVCASCNPTGARPAGAQSEGGNVTGGSYGNEWFAGSIPAWTHYEGHSFQTNSPGEEDGTLYQSRYLSDSGRLFFNSHDALVPQDVNGTWDVYEYEPPGVGGCSTSSLTFSERSGGCVDLISSGTSAEESAFLDASENGSDVFFLTTAQLGPQDRDTAMDVYDAHECTAVAPCSATVTTPPPCTTGDACKAAPTLQPTLFGAPSSETFSGAGNVTPSTGPAVTQKSSMRAQKLAKALRACRKRPRKRRAGCERQARRAYGSAANGAGKSRSGKGGR